MAGPYRLGELNLSLPAGMHVVKASTANALADATAIIEAAEARAAEIIAAAEDAYREQERRGYEKGMADARLADVARLIEESDALDRAIADIQRDLATIVTAAVRKLVDGFDDQTRVEAVVRSALKQLRRERRLQLRVSPAQVAPLKVALADIQSSFPEIELIDVVEDAALEAPRIIVEATVGRVDGDLGERLEDLEALIRGALRRVANDRSVQGAEAAS